ncbi:hypothetical protein [Gorillibacterium sp. sgz500922]|uniref:hypothetical protein n=1 Tax=Gorillibacterium sp. sgz500922 TaxID=3446694 RepID=UPI003F679650
MSRRRMMLTPFDYVIYGLALFGALMYLISNPARLIAILIPVVIIGGLFVYNRYLGARNRGYHPSSNPRYSGTNKYAEAKKRSKTVPFRVIPGSKDSDDEHRYH